MSKIKCQREKTKNARDLRFNHYLSQKVADKRLGGQSTLCQIVLRRDSSRHKARVPMFAYVVETEKMVRYIIATSGKQSGVVEVKKGDILSISDAQTKVDKLMPPKVMKRAA